MIEVAVHLKHTQNITYALFKQKYLHQLFEERNNSLDVVQFKDCKHMGIRQLTKFEAVPIPTTREHTSPSKHCGYPNL